MTNQSKEAPIPGLAKMRENPKSTTKHYCANCKCNRYSPCGCMKKVGTK